MKKSSSLVTRYEPSILPVVLGVEYTIYDLNDLISEIRGRKRDKVEIVDTTSYVTAKRYTVNLSDFESGLIAHSNGLKGTDKLRYVKKGGMIFQRVD